MPLATPKKAFITQVTNSIGASGRPNRLSGCWYAFHADDTTPGDVTQYLRKLSGWDRSAMTHPRHLTLQQIMEMTREDMLALRDTAYHATREEVEVLCDSLGIPWELDPELKLTP